MPNREAMLEYRRVAIAVLSLLAVSYILASIVATFIMSFMLQGTMKSINKPQSSASAPVVGGPVTLAFGSGTNFREVKKVIMERNLFNSEGKFPQESDPSKSRSDAKVFDINAPCQKPTINVELVGTIFMGDSATSLATVREQGYSEADVYRVGESIYGNDEAIVAAIERKRLVLNNKGVKECVELAADKIPGAVENDGFPDVGGTAPNAPNRPGGDPGGSGCGSTAALEAAYVESELGPGFGKIIQAARMVPNNDASNQINGFKIFAIDQASIFGRIGFQNGDVITQVNNTSMTQPEQGFALYQTLQENREFTIQLLRGGTTPCTINVRVK